MNEDAGPTWLRMDEIENAVDNLIMIRHFLTTLSDPIRWKWAILALHQSLYGFAICSTRPSDASWTLKNPENPNSFLISIWNALARARDPLWMARGDWVPLTTTEEEDKAIEKIVTEFRNEFEHFRPKAWAIEVSGMPFLFMNVLRVIEHLALGTNTVTYVEESLREAVRKEIDALRAYLESGASA